MLIYNEGLPNTHTRRAFVKNHQSTYLKVRTYRQNSTAIIPLAKRSDDGKEYYTYLPAKRAVTMLKLMLGDKQRTDVNGLFQVIYFLNIGQKETTGFCEGLPSTLCLNNNTISFYEGAIFVCEIPPSI